MKRIILIYLVMSSALAHGQAWSGILTSTRAIDWTTAGLPSSITYGSGGSACTGSTANCVETITNPWTPPTRTKSGSTVNCANTSGDAGTINTAIAAASPGSFILLGPTTCDITSDLILASGVTLRGSGAQATQLNFTGTSSVRWSGCCTGINSGPLSATSYAAGTTSVTITGTTCTTNCTSNNLVVGNMAYIEQCDTGWNGSGTNFSTDPNCTSGSYSDPGTIWVCGIDYGVCAQNNINTDTSHFYERQTVVITGVVNNGGGSYTVTFTPGLRLPNISSNNNAILFWTPYGIPPTSKTKGAGLEDVTINFPFNQNAALNVGGYAPWIKGTRILGGVVTSNISIGYAAHWLFANNYIFGLTYNNLSSANTEPFLRTQDSDGLALNNIFQSGQCFWANGQTMGDVIAYNYCRDGATLYYQNVSLDHNPYEAYLMLEGNQMGYIQDDDTHGTHDLNTWFRNYLSGWDPPYTTLNSQAFSLGNYHRFDNALGNALGGTKSTAYQGTSASVGNEYVVATTDALAGASFMRWGNCDVINGACRFLAAEVPNTTNMPAGTYPNATAYQNATPANNNLPCSFFMSGASFTTSPCSIKPSGGTSLSWWKVCTTWSAFPTSCSATQVQPFPPVGPDQTSGPYVSGFAYDIPAAIAYNDLPIDSALQNSLTITGSSWSGGTETLTVSFAGIDNSSANHIMGGFQLSGVNAACIPSGLPANNEILMTGSSTTTVTYALPNPSVACTGTLKWPDVRQFDERVFQSDSSTPVTGYSPTSLAFGNQVVNTTSGGQTITLTNTGSANLVTSAIALATGTQFAIDGSSTCVLGGQTLAPAASCTIVIKFTPTSTGAKSDTINVTSNAPSSVDHLALTGTGVQAATSYAPTFLVFGNQVTNTTSSPQTVTLTNSGTANLITTNIALQTGTQFAITGASTCVLGGQTITPGNSCTIVITFTPTTNGAKSDNIRVTSNAPTSVDSVALSGTGITAGGQTLAPVLSPATGIVPQVVTATSASGGTIIECWAISPTTPVTNGLGTGCNVGTAMVNGTTLVMSTPSTLNVVAGTSTLTDSAVANGVYTGITLGTYNPLAIAWQAPLSTDTTHFNTFVLNILPFMSGIGGSSSTATQNNMGNVYWSDIDDCSHTAPCATEANYDWTNIDTQLSAYIAATVGSNGTFANGCAGGQRCKIILRIAPQQDSGTGVTKTPDYVMSATYAASLGVAPQDVSFATAWPGAISSTWPGTVPCTNINTGLDACIANASGACTAYGSATCGTVHGVPDANQNLSGFPVVYEVPIMTAYQKFITAVFKHYSASGTAPGPTIAPYISSIAIGLAAGSENNPGNVGSGSVTNPVPGPGGVLANTFWPCPAGLAACPATFNQCGYLTTWTGASVNGMSCPATLGGDGYVTAMDKFFAGLTTNGITLSQSAHGGPPANTNTFNGPGTAPYADAEALLASQYNPGFMGFGQQSERLSDITAYVAGNPTTQNWVVDFARFKVGVRHLITINDGGANPHAAEFGINTIGSCSAGKCTLNCTGTNGNSCEVFGDGTTIFITGNSNPNYNGFQVINCGGTCSAGTIQFSTSDNSGGAGGKLWSPSYLPLLLPFASQHLASYVGVWECDLDYAFGVTTANFTSPCGGNPGPDTAWQNAIINFEKGTPVSTSAIKGTAACKGKCVSF